MALRNIFLLISGILVGPGVFSQGVEEEAAAEPMEVHAAEGYIGDDAVELLYKRDIVVNQIGSTEISGGVFFNEVRDLIVTATGLSRIGTNEFRRFVIHGGGRIYASFLHTENDDVLGGAVGGTARYYLGRQRGSSVILSAFYAPDILTFGSADGVRDVSLRFEMGLRTQTSVFVGYRILEFDLAEDREVDDSVHIGARYRF